MIRLPLPATLDQAAMLVEAPDIDTIDAPKIGDMADDHGKLVGWTPTGWYTIQEDASYWQVENPRGYWSLVD